MARQQSVPSGEAMQAFFPYASMGDRLLEGCQVIGRDWCFLYVNDACARQARKSKEELLGRTMMEVYPGIEETGLFGHLKCCMENRQAHRMENTFVFPDGEEGTFELSIHPVPEGLVVFSLETTEREDTLEALRRNEARLQRVIDKNADGILLLDLEGHIMLANPAAETLLNRGDLRGELFGLPVAMEDHVEIELLSSGGSRATAEMRVVETDWDGKSAYLVSLRDVTDRKRLTETLKKRTAELHERVKELNCLYDLAKLVEQPGITLEEILQETVEVMRRSWQYPEVTAVRIARHDRVYETGGFRETARRQTSDLRVNGKKAGIVEVIYLEERPEADEGPFLKEERSLIEAVAERLGKVIERKNAEEELARSYRINAALAELASMLVSRRTIEEISLLVLEHAKSLTDSAFGYVGFIDPETGWLVCPSLTRDIWGRCEVPGKEVVFKEFGGLWGWVLENGQSLMTNEPAGDARSTGTPEGHIPIRRFLCAPAKVGDVVVGQIGLTNAGRDYVREDLELVERLADLYAAAVERRRSEIALRKNEEQLRLLVENMTEPLIKIDTDGRFLYASPSFCRMFGKTKEELIGTTVWPWIMPEDMKRSEEALARLQEPPFTDKLEIRTRTVHGWRWISWTCKAILDENGVPRSAVVVGRDVDERKKAENALRASKMEYRDFVDSLPLGVYRSIPGPEGKFLMGNTTFLKMFGLESEEEMRRTSPAQLYREPGQREEFSERLLREGRVFEMELSLRKKDGTPVWGSVSARRVEKGKKQIYFDCSILDITERKEAEKERKHLEDQLRQAQKMEALGTLAGGIAHDFNNILTAIIGSAHLAGLDMGEKEPASRNLQQVLRASERARGLVDQILTFSRRTDQSKGPVEIRPVVKEALKMLRASLPSTIQIQQEIEEQLPCVMADPTQIHQILVNLCTNAVHAMADEGGVLRVALTQEEADAELLAKHPDLPEGPCLRLEVSDTGSGMGPEVMGRIFEPYFTTKEKSEGTGLGLAVVHGIVEDHKGAIEVRSEPGRGTAFTLYFPATEVDEVRETETTGKQVQGGRERILLVDDEKPLVDLGRQLLERLGYSVTARTSSVEALELFRSSPDRFDLVITDVTMPNMTGDRLAGELLNLRSDIPVIAMTGFSENISPETARKIGIKALLMKPLVIDELADTIRTILDNSSF